MRRQRTEVVVELRKVLFFFCFVCCLSSEKSTWLLPTDLATDKLSHMEPISVGMFCAYYCLIMFQ